MMSLKDLFHHRVSIKSKLLKFFTNIDHFQKKQKISMERPFKRTRAKSDKLISQIENKEVNKENIADQQAKNLVELNNSVNTEEDRLNDGYMQYN